MAHHLNPSNYVDDGAAATRVTLVTAAGTAQASAAASVQRVIDIAKVTTAVTTPITAGKKSFSVQVLAVNSAATPTLDGVALPVGTYAFVAPTGDTLEAMSLVTVVNDIVVVTSIT